MSRKHGRKWTENIRLHRNYSVTLLVPPFVLSVLIDGIKVTPLAGNNSQLPYNLKCKLDKACYLGRNVASLSIFLILVVSFLDYFLETVRKQSWPCISTTSQKLYELFKKT